VPVLLPQARSSDSAIIQVNALANSFAFKSVFSNAYC